MRTMPILLLSAAWLGSNAGEAAAQSARAFQWQTASPESQGISSSKLEALNRALASRKTKSFLVIRNDKIVHEWYAPDHSVDKTHYTASLAKAIVGGVALAVAIHDGHIRLDDPVSKYVPQWKSDPRKARITVRHLGSHTSGLEDSSVPGISHPNEPGWKGEFWKRHAPPHDAFSISRDITPLLFDPGSGFQYSNPGIAMLSYVVTAARHQAQAPHDVRTLLRDRIMRPIGVSDQEWSVGYGQTYTVDELPLVAAWGGGGYTARAVARIGRLMLHEGDWEGTRLLSPDAVRQVTSNAGLPAHCGMGWWTNAGGRYAGVPRDAYWGAGAGDQLLLVIPSLRLVAVRNGAALEDVPPTTGEIDASRDPRARLLFQPLVDAVDSPPEIAGQQPRIVAGSDSKPDTRVAPYPPSPVITGIEWSPKETIVRRAKGCDNWPLTWADDGDLYGAYGDGNGFEPFLSQKLSLGLARITGGPTDFNGINLRSPSIEQLGEGPKGKKASGLLMVDGVLYMWVRNAANSQLAWSDNHGKTWNWADWKWTEGFGSPTFLNFGRNYDGARDDFVYVYSSDADSAYEAADRMVLARVPKGAIRERQRYEFFSELDAAGAPQWTRDIARRGAVFQHPGRCYRSGISYYPARKRYLWCQVLPESTHAGGPRFQGGFGVYESAEPWGPWRTVYFTNNWDVGPGETSTFPTKWMSPDGRTLYLVFSGDDYFSVRRADLRVSN